MKKYKQLYADPPWQYRNTTTGRNNTAGAASKYKTMPLEEICALPIADISKKSAALFLWVTTPLLPNGFVVM